MSMRLSRPLPAASVRRLSLAALLLCVSCGGKATAKLGNELREDFGNLTIAPAEWYAPAERDIIPALLPLRERRAWDKADYARFWTDPGKLDTSALDEAAERAVDAMLEKIP